MSKNLGQILCQKKSIKQYDSINVNPLKQLNNNIHIKNKNDLSFSPLHNDRSKTSYPNTAANSNNKSRQYQQYQEIPLTYSNTTQFVAIEDHTAQLKKFTFLFSSKQNIKNHISQSLLLHKYDHSISEQIGGILSHSFSEYIRLSYDLYDKISKKQIKLINPNKANHPEQNRKQGREQNILCKSSDNKWIFLLIKKIQSQIYQLNQKFICFQSTIYKKLGTFQDSLINITLIRNHLLQDKIGDKFWQQKYRVLEKQNKKLINLIKEKQQIIEQYSKELKKMQNNAKDQQNICLKKRLADVNKQLEQNKTLYDNLIQKTLNLQKQLFMFSNDINEERRYSDSNQSFQIVQKSFIHFLGDNSGVTPSQS